MKFLVPNYSCLQNPWLGGLPPPDPRSFCPVNWICLTPLPNKIPEYATVSTEKCSAYTQEVNLKVLYFSIYFTYVCFGPDVRTRNFSTKICGVGLGVAGPKYLTSQTSLTTSHHSQFTRYFGCVAVTNRDWPNFVECCFSLPTCAIIFSIFFWGRKWVYIFLVRQGKSN